MTPAAILRARLRLLDRRLGSLKSAIQARSAQESDWVRDEFLLHIHDRRAKLKELLRDKVIGSSWADCETREHDSNKLFGEALAWLQAGGTNALGGGGPGDLARALVGELSGSCATGIIPFVAPDIGDSFTDFVSIIRLRFPPADVWDVPVVAHEFGHFAASRILQPADGSLWRPQAFKDLLSRHSRAVPHHLSEHWADAFATYALGPAFALSALLLRFSIADAFRPAETHPCFADRATVILGVLDRMGGEDDNGMCRMSGWLLNKWSEVTASVEGRDGGPSDTENAEQQRMLAGDLFALLDGSSARRTRYGSYAHAVNRIQNVLLTDRAPPPDWSTTADLLNACWAARLLGQDQDLISSRALRFASNHGRVRTS